MHILGWIAYCVLVFYAVQWALIVRTNLGNSAALGTAISSLLLTLFAITVPCLGINKLHSIWMIPCGMLFGTVLNGLWLRSVVALILFRMIRPIGIMWLRLLRIGITPEKILQGEIEAQARAQALNEHFRNNHRA